MTSLAEKIILDCETLGMPLLSEKLQELNTISVEEDEQIARQYYESGWKDELRQLLQPFDEERERDWVQAIVRLLLKVTAELVTVKTRDKATHHYLLREVKALREKTKSL